MMPTDTLGGGYDRFFVNKPLTILFMFLGQFCRHNIIIKCRTKMRAITSQSPEGALRRKALDSHPFANGLLASNSFCIAIETEVSGDPEVVGGSWRIP